MRKINPHIISVLGYCFCSIFVSLCTVSIIYFQCDFCNEEPIAGTRWHCVTCINSSVDFCTDCLVTQMYSKNSHPVTHKFVIIRGSDDREASSSDSESEPSSDKNEECSSSAGSISDLEMDANSKAQSEPSDFEETKNTYDILNNFENNVS